MNILVVGNTLHFQGRQYRCAVGKGGFSSDKREGDGCTPVGVFPLRECYYRADRIVEPQTGIDIYETRVDDGWCDDPKSTQYNRFIKLPYPFSHELLWREDHVYDVVVVIGYNDELPVPGKGSAIFLHLAHDDYRPTEGCVALAKNDLLGLLPQLKPDTCIEIREK